MVALATLAELEARLGRTFDEGSIERARAEADLDDMSVFALSMAGDPDWTIDGANDTCQVPEDVRRIVLAAAKRKFQNPEGFRRKSAGAFEVEVDEGFTTNYFTEFEADLLRSYSPGGGLGVIETTRGYRQADLGVKYRVVTSDGFELRPFYDSE